MRNLDFDPNNMPRDILEAVGLVTSSSSHTEYVMEQGIGGCAGIDIEYTAAITTHMSAPQRDNALRAAAEIRIDNLDDLDQLDDLLDEVLNVLPLRNSYVHNSLCRDIDTNEIFRIRVEARGTVDVDLVPVTVNQIISDANRIYSAGIALYLFLDSRGTSCAGLGEGATARP